MPEILPGLLAGIDRAKQAVKSNFDLLFDNPAEYFRQIDESARDINRNDRLAVQGKNAELAGRQATAEQVAAMQALDRRAEGLAMGFAGSVKPVTGILGDGAQGIGGIAKRYQDQGVKLDVSQNGNTLNVSRIVVPKESRGQGIGSNAMQDIINYADQNGLQVTLSPSTDFGATSVSRLKDFYKQFGFIENKGRNKDFSVSESMYRAPKSVAAERQTGGLLGTPEQRATEQGYIDYYHGTGRLDRLLEGKAFDPKRATSGAMPFGSTEKSLASNYAMGKSDTSLAAVDTGELKNYFQVSPKDVGLRGKKLIAAEDSWWSLPAEKRAEIADKARRIGFENPAEGTGKWVLHPDSRGMPFSESHWDYTLKREAGGNPLTALRKVYAESGLLDPYAPAELADLYRLVGFDKPVSQINAPWTEAKGVFVGKARITNPLYTDNYENLAQNVIPQLKQQFVNDRSRKLAYGADPWDKRVRFTPKEWVAELEQDVAAGKNSHVWTSIPDKVTEGLKSLGYNGIIDKSGKGGGAAHPVVIPFDPGQIRSRFAQFDPARIGEPDLLAAGIPLGLLAGTEVEIPKPKKAKK